MSRINDLMSHQPRVWAMVDDSDDEWLEHSVFIQRQIRQAGTTDGTPNYAIQTWGPYDGRLSTADGSKSQQPDKWVENVRRHLAVRSDVKPQEQDYVLVFAPFLPLVPAGALRSWDTGFNQLPSALQPPPASPSLGNVNAARFRVTATTEPRDAHWLAEGAMVLWSVELQYSQEM